MMSTNTLLELLPNIIPVINKLIWVFPRFYNVIYVNLFKLV